MLQKVFLLATALVLMAGATSAQSTDARIEMLKAQVKEAAETAGRDKAIALALMGYDYLATDHPALRRLLYETYYTTQDFTEYEESYEEEANFTASDWSRDGQRLAIAVSDGTIRIYDPRSPVTYQTIPVGDPDVPSAVLDVAFSPDGRWLAFCTADGNVSTWNLTQQTIGQTWQHSDYVRTIAWSPDGQSLAAGGDEKTVWIYRIGQDNPTFTLEGHSDWVRAVSWSADGKWIASASDDFTTRIWSATSGTLYKVLDAHSDYCRDAAFAPRGNALATVSDDLNTYHYEDVTDSKSPRALQGHENWIMALAWSPDGKTIATADNGGGILLRASRGEDVTYYNAFEMETAWIDLDFAPKGEFFAATSPQEVAIYRVGAPTPEQRILMTATIATASESSEPMDLETRLATLLPRAQQLFPNQDKTILGVVDANYQLQAIDMKTGKLVYAITQHTDWIRSVSWSPDGRLLATGSDDSMVGIWDATTGAMQHLLEGHSDWVRSVAFSPDGKIVASGSDDGTVRFWNPSSGLELGATESVGSYLLEIAWSPDQQYVSGFASDGYLHVWNAQTFERIFANEEVILPGSMRWVDAQNLGVQYMDGRPMQWSTVDGMMRAGQGSGAMVKNAKGQQATANGAYMTISGTPTLLVGHRAPIHTLEWSPDGTYLVSQSVDGIIGIWNGSSPEPLALLALSDGTQKSIIWSSQGDGFYLPGAAGKLLLPPNQLREQISAADYADVFAEWDVLSYELDKIFLNDPAIIARMKGSVKGGLAEIIAQFFTTRAQAQPTPAAKAADEQTAAGFR